MSNKQSENVRYEVITQEDPDTGDVLLPIPPNLLEELGWKEGDEIEFGVDTNGNYFFKRASK